jgi:hypothetical protein
MTKTTPVSTPALTCNEKHVIGVCASHPIRDFDDQAVTTFLARLTTFNHSKKQVNHPGFMLLADFCMDCGAPLDRVNNKKRWDQYINPTFEKPE